MTIPSNSKERIYVNEQWDKIARPDYGASQHLIQWKEASYAINNWSRSNEHSTRVNACHAMVQLPRNLCLIQAWGRVLAQTKVSISFLSFQVVQNLWCMAGVITCVLQDNCTRSMGALHSLLWSAFKKKQMSCHKLANNSLWSRK